jgi:hypothetical protein
MLLSNIFLQFLFCSVFLYCLYLIGLTKNIHTLLFLIWCVCVLGCAYLNMTVNLEILTIIFLFIQTGALMIFLIFNFIVGWRVFTLLYTECVTCFFFICYACICVCVQYYDYSEQIVRLTTVFSSSLFLHFGDLFFNFCVVEWCFLNCYLCCGIFCCNLIYCVHKQQRAYEFLCIKRLQNFFFLKQTLHAQTTKIRIIYFK